MESDFVFSVSWKTTASVRRQNLLCTIKLICFWQLHTYKSRVTATQIWLHLLQFVLWYLLICHIYLGASTQSSFFYSYPFLSVLLNAHETWSQSARYEQWNLQLLTRSNRDIKRLTVHHRISDRPYRHNPIFHCMVILHTVITTKHLLLLFAISPQVGGR